jgi:hypothetical protein
VILHVGDVTLPHVKVDKIHTFLKWIRWKIRLGAIGHFTCVLTRNAINVVAALTDEKISPPKAQFSTAQFRLLSSTRCVAYNPKPAVVNRAAIRANKVSHDITQIVAMNLNHLIPVSVQ